jgi:uncharacterized protein
VSQLAHKFVNDAREIVKTGDVVRVRVLEVDLARKRISLTMKLDAPAAAKGQGAKADNRYRPAARGERATGQTSGHAGGRPAEVPGAMASAFAKLVKR